MSLILTKHKIARSREGFPRAKGQIIQYRVDGLPSYIANFGGDHQDRWRVFHTKKGTDAGWRGDYKTADEALAALQSEY
jgi:hypothetical protein